MKRESWETEDYSGVKLSELIDKYLAREPSPPKIGVYRPSEIGNCLRMNYYKRFLPEKLLPEKLRMFKSADLAHSFIRDVLAAARDEGVELLSWEEPFTLDFGEFVISGRWDDLIVVRLPTEEVPVIVEVKSLSGKTLEHITAPKLHHLYQIHPYMRAANTTLGVLWYLARDTYADKTFTVFYSQGVMDRVLLRLRRLHAHLVEGTLPPPEARDSKEIRFLCSFCQYWRECREEINPQLELL